MNYSFREQFTDEADKQFDFRGWLRSQSGFLHFVSINTEPKLERVGCGFAVGLGSSGFYVGGG